MLFFSRAVLLSSCFLLGSPFPLPLVASICLICHLQLKREVFLPCLRRIVPAGFENFPTFGFQILGTAPNIGVKLRFPHKEGLEPVISGATMPVGSAEEAMRKCPGWIQAGSVLWNLSAINKVQKLVFPYTWERNSLNSSVWITVELSLQARRGPGCHVFLGKKRISFLWGYMSTHLQLGVVRLFSFRFPMHW